MIQDINRRSSFYQQHHVHTSVTINRTKRSGGEIMTVIIFITGGDDSDSSTYRTLLIEKQKECVI